MIYEENNYIIVEDEKRVLCTQCGHINQADKFCVKCGTSLGEPTTAETPEAPTASAMPQYFSYFLQVLKNPVRTGQNSTEEQMVNGLITLVLFALILPLTVYFQLRASLRNMEYIGLGSYVPFGGVVIKPFFILLIFVMIVNSIIFIVLRIGNATVNYREVTARFGTFVIPSSAFFLVSIVFSLISGDSAIIGLFIGMGLFSWLAAICFVIYSFMKNRTDGLDAFYGVVITYIASFILLIWLGKKIVFTLFGDFWKVLNF